MPNYQEGTAMPNAVVMTGYGPPEVLKWAQAPLPELGHGQIRIKVKAAASAPPIWPCGPATSRTTSRCLPARCSASRPTKLALGRSATHQEGT